MVKLGRKSQQRQVFRYRGSSHEVGWWKNKKHHLNEFWWVESSHVYLSSGSHIGGPTFSLYQTSAIEPLEQLQRVILDSTSKRETLRDGHTLERKNVWVLLQHR
jgi:hypothetical protein